MDDEPITTFTGGNGQPTRNGWRFDKTVSVGTMIAIVGVVVGLGGPILLWGRAMENRVQIIETTIAQKDATMLVAAVESREQQRLFLERMDKFNEQITQLRIALGNSNAQVRR